jgi:hypothetical protein
MPSRSPRFNLEPEQPGPEQSDFQRTARHAARAWMVFVLIKCCVVLFGLAAIFGWLAFSDPEFPSIAIYPLSGGIIAALTLGILIWRWKRPVQPVVPPEPAKSTEELKPQLRSRHRRRL